MSHTKGEWEVNRDRTQVQDENARVLLKDPNTSLFDLSITERESNLRLAAAAPKLLEVARQVVRVLSGIEHHVHGGPALLLEAQTALSKAEVR